MMFVSPKAKGSGRKTCLPAKVVTKPHQKLGFTAVIVPFVYEHGGVLGFALIAQISYQKRRRTKVGGVCVMRGKKRR